MKHEENSKDIGAEILLEIKNSEKKADDTLNDARKQRDSIIQEAVDASSKLIESKRSELSKQSEKKISDFKEKSHLLREEKLNEGKGIVKQVRSKSDKNVPKAVDHIIAKFEEMI